MCHELFPAGIALISACCTCYARLLPEWLRHVPCAGNLPPAQDAASYCIANIQAGVVWGNGDGTFMSAVNVVSSYACASDSHLIPSDL